MSSKLQHDRQLLKMRLHGRMKPALIAAPIVLVAGHAVADYFPITDEYILNSDPGNDSSPGFGGNNAVAMDADGNFVAIWTQYYSTPGRGGSNYTVARVFNADGTPRTGDITVTTNSATDNSAVAVDDDGDFVVVWTEYTYGGAGNGQNYAVIGQRFDANGNPQGPQIPVSGGGGRNPTVGMDADGDFVVAWENYYYYTDRGGYTNIEAQRFNASGAPQGGPFDVSQGQGRRPSVALDDDGDFAIAWTSANTNPTRGYSGGYALVRVFDNLGNPVTGPTIVNDSTPAGAEVLGAVVASDADGDFAVAWSEYENLYSGSGPDNPGNREDRPGSANRGGNYDGNIRARQFNANGTPVAPSFQVNTSTFITYRSRTTIAMDDDGDFIVGWASYAQDGMDDYDIFVRVFDAQGNPDPDRPGEVLVNQTTEGDQEDPSVAMDSDGDFVVAWRANDGNPYAVIGGDVYGNDVAGRVFTRQARAPLVIPTLSGIGMTVLGGALAGLGVWQRRRRKTERK